MLEEQTMSVETSAPIRASRPAIALAAALGVLVAGTGVLWGFYGTDVFFEMVRNGWTACF
jgi:hypothetical protein